AEHDVGIGDSRNRATFVVADRARIGAGGLRTYREHARNRIDVSERSSSRTDRMHVNLGQEVFVLRHVGYERVRRLAVENDAHIERRAAHVGGDDVGTVHEPAQVQRPTDAGYGTRI